MAITTASENNILDAIRTFTQEGFSIESIPEEDHPVGRITWDNPTASGLPTVSQIQTKAEELMADNAVNALRSTRDQLISESDWMGNQDVTMSDAWKTYRQALRDITKTITNDTDRWALANDRKHSSWPTKP